MRAIVTGGAGFIGSHLVDALIARGDEVIVIDNLSTGKKENVNPKAKLFNRNICSYDAIEGILESCKNVDYVFHLAALPRVPYSIDHPIATNAVNINGTLNVIAMAVKLNVKRLIYSSSSSIYGNQPVSSLREDMPANPLSPYALQKFAAEKYCQMLCEPKKPNRLNSVVCLRYFNVYGPRQSDSDSYSSVIGIFLKNAREGRVSVIHGDGEQSRAFVHVTDVVMANVLAAESKKIVGGEIINIGSPKSYTINQVARMIGGGYVHESPRKGDVRHTEADITKAKELLGWEPKVSLLEGIAELKTELKKLYEIV